MNGRPVDVRVGIVSYNTVDLLAACLDALPAALGDLRAEVVVVDNASDDGSAEMLAARRDVTAVHQTENVGYARAMNAALASTQAPVLVALNPDTRPPPGSLAVLVRALAAQPSVGLLGPRLANHDGTPQPSAYRFPSIRLALVTGFLPHRFRHGRLGRRFGLEDAAPHQSPTDVDWLVGAVHVIRASALAGAAPYTERWFMYAEDMELCWRLHRTGWRVRLIPDTAITHVGNAAGAQRWTRLAREQRHLDATYDWYVGAHGRAAARRWALCQLLGIEAKRLVLSLRASQEVRLHRTYLAQLAEFHRARVRDARSTGLAASQP
jgi:hypothetical protein